LFRGLERLVDRRVLAADERRAEAILVRALVREHAVVAHPVLVDGEVLARAIAVRGVGARIVVEERAAPRRAALADAARAAEEPDAGLEAEVARGERADGAHVLRHQRVVVVELPAGRDGDLAEVAALADPEHRILREL